MACKNTVRSYVEDAYYHVYNRGINYSDIFLDQQDYEYFLGLIKRHLSREQHADKRGKVYETYAGRIELLSYCLMPNHFHMLFYLNNDKAAISELMRKIASAYTTYFNKKYKREGPLFRGVYKASRINAEPHLVHVTRVIHRSHDDYYKWSHSSLSYFIGDSKSDWVLPDRVYRLYDWGMYEKILNDHEDHKRLNNELEILGSSR